MICNTFIQSIQILKIMTLMYAANKTHVLNNLIMIEFVSIAVIAAAMKNMTWMNLEMYMVLFLMIVLITESILGLSLMINMIRTHSNEFMKSTMTLMS